MYEHLYVYPELLRVLYDRGTIPGVRIRPCKKFAGAAAGAGTGTAFVYLPGDFCEFCKTSIPVPGTSGSSVRFSYPCSEYTNPTENSLSRTVTRLYMRDFFLDGDIIFGPRLTVATTPIRNPNPHPDLNPRQRHAWLLCWRVVVFGKTLGRCADIYRCCT